MTVSPIIARRDGVADLIPHNRPLILPEDQAVADRVLQSGWIAHGSEGEALEHDFARYFGGGNACAVSSGSAALFLALHTLGIESGHRVAIPSYACTALLNAVHGVGAQPVLIDNAPNSFNISAETLRQAVADSPFDATIAVHTYGEAVNIASLYGSTRYVIEDCCHAIGGSFAGRRLGSTGDLAVFSFYATKPITSGHGGLLYDPSGNKLDRAFDYRNFDMPETYRPRSNIQLSDIQAAIARSQFARIGAIAERRRVIAARYLAATPSRLLLWPSAIDGNLMPYRFALKAADENHRAAMQDIFTAAGVTTINPLTPRELLHRYMGLDHTVYPNAEEMCRHTLSVPLYAGLTDAEVDRVVAVLGRLPPR